MGTYDFDRIIDRRNTRSLKWDVADGELPMWVADMDFAVAPCIQAALEQRVRGQIFGYSTIGDAWGEAYRDWWKSHHGLEIDSEWLIFTTGVIPAMSTAVRKFTTPAEKVIVQTPVYHIFFNSIINNGRRILENPLVYRDGRYEMDLEDLEEKMSDPLATMMLLCNPHNPVGKIWDADTLGEIGRLAEKHHVLVFSDEIHCDLTAPGVGYVPYASVSETCAGNSITAVAPTKTFGIPGIQSAAVIVPGEGIRERMNRALNTDEVAEPNAFAVDATVAAFSEEGWGWLTELRDYIEENKQTVYRFVSDRLEKVIAVRQEATYLMWLDVSAYTKDSAKLAADIRKKTGLYLSDGRVFGGNGNTFLRMNVACPGSRLLEGLDRLAGGLAAVSQRVDASAGRL